MTKRKIKPGPIGPDVDLDNDEIYLADGWRLTVQVAEEIAEAGPGPASRPSICVRWRTSHTEPDCSSAPAHPRHPGEAGQVPRQAVSGCQS